MSITKISDPLTHKGWSYTKKEIYNPCYDEQHNTPSLIHLEPGEYKHICPSCKKVTYITVPIIFGYTER